MSEPAYRSTSQYRINPPQRSFSRDFRVSSFFRGRIWVAGFTGPADSRLSWQRFWASAGAHSRKVPCVSPEIVRVPGYLWCVRGKLKLEHQRCVSLEICPLSTFSCPKLYNPRRRLVMVNAYTLESGDNAQCLNRAQGKLPRPVPLGLNPFQRTPQEVAQGDVVRLLSQLQILPMLFRSSSLKIDSKARFGVRKRKLKNHSRGYCWHFRKKRE